MFEVPCGSEKGRIDGCQVGEQEKEEEEEEGRDEPNVEVCNI